LPFLVGSSFLPAADLEPKSIPPSRIGSVEALKPSPVIVP
jgi:hypothetical protein